MVIKKSYYPYEIRKEMLEAIRYVDEVIPEKNWDQKISDIKNNDDLVLSEIHSRICGKIADTLFERIAETDGKITKDK